jgi:hypothetical protein
MVRVLRVMVMLTVVLCAGAAGAAEPAALARARALYNAGTYSEAIEAASAARSEPEFADAAALVMARSYLERFRENGDSADLVTARDTLATIRSASLTPRDQVDLLIGLGQALYLSESFGAAAELFETALDRSPLLGAPDRLRLLDWWATALDREAQARPPDRRTHLAGRIAVRMEDELRTDPGNAAANYWLVVARRGQGDLDGAWDVATAAWVRALLLPATAERLRADVDRFVTEVLVPERARTRPAREQAEVSAELHAEWNAFKQQWK